VILLDWAYPGAPGLPRLAWYLASTGPAADGHTKERAADDLRAALEHHGVDTAGWWEEQLALCLLGAVVEFGWEKALGDDES